MVSCAGRGLPGAAVQYRLACLLNRPGQSKEGFMKEKICVLSAVLLVAVVPVRSKSLLYQRRSAQGSTPVHAVIDTLENTFRISLTWQEKGGEVTHIVETDSSLETVSWRYRDEARNSDFRACKKGERIMLRGKHQGEEVQREFELDGYAWLQMFPHEMAGFITSDAGTRYYRAIGIQGRGDMKMATFKAIKKGIEPIDLNGCSVDAVHVEISLTGFLSMFWTGHYWFRESDGRYLRFEGNMGGPGSEQVVTEFQLQSRAP